jgi:hypothetical protein
MQSPIVLFSHTAKTVAVIPTGPASNDKRLAEVLASQRAQVATSGRPTT